MDRRAFTAGLAATTVLATDSFAGLRLHGNNGGSPLPPGTIVLSQVISPEYPTTNPGWYIQMPNTKGNGTIIQLQIQVSGGSWSSLLVNTSNTLNSTQNEYETITNSQSALGSNSYQARAIVDGVTSNIVAFTV